MSIKSPAITLDEFCDITKTNNRQLKMGCCLNKEEDIKVKRHKKDN